MSAREFYAFNEFEKECFNQNNGWFYLQEDRLLLCNIDSVHAALQHIEKVTKAEVEPAYTSNYLG